MRKVPMRLFLLLLPLPAATACVSAGPIVAHNTACSELLPPEWLKGVDGAPLPGSDAIGDWVAFGDAQTGRLDVANDRYKSAIGIVGRCEKRDAAAVKGASRGFFGRLIHGG